MNDLISRQAAIDVADAVWSVTGDKNVAKVWDQIKDLPSAQSWIPVKTRPMDEEEREHFIEHLGWHLDEDEAVMFESLMPCDSQEVWVCSKCGNVWQDICVVDEGIGLEGNGDWQDIVAWMPFERPEPYKGGEESAKKYVCVSNCLRVFMKAL